MLSDRELQVQRPRLREKGSGTSKEVEIPAYAAMHNQPRLAASHVGHSDAECLHPTLQGRDSENGEYVDVSKSSVSPQIIEASEAEMDALMKRRFDDVKLWSI